MADLQNLLLFDSWIRS